MVFFSRYCQKFSDKFTSCCPIFKSEQRLSPVEKSEFGLKAREMEFQSTVQLPISCPLREKITVRRLHLCSAEGFRLSKSVPYMHVK